MLPPEPSPPKNAKVESVFSTNITISFEDPDDIAECPIIAYRTVCEKDTLGAELGSKVGAIYYQHFENLEPDTKYKLLTTSISTKFVESDPDITYATTKPAE